MKKIGIALAAYQPKLEIFIEQLKSIQNQTHTNWICILTFDSPMQLLFHQALLKPFFEDPRFIWIENATRLGHKKNFEKAIQETLKYSVDAIACSDQDDIWYTNKLEICLKKLNTLPPLSLVHSDMHIMDKKGMIGSQTAWALEKRGIHNVKPRHFYVRNIVAGCSMLFDAELARRYPEIPEGVLFHDWWFAVVSSYFGGVHAIPIPLYAYRQHGENEVGITPYQTLFSPTTDSDSQSFLKVCQRRWNSSFLFVQGVKQVKLPISPMDDIIFLFPYDFGFGFLLLALFNAISDIALTRACLARAVGKFISKGHAPHPPHALLTTPSSDQAPKTIVSRRSPPT